MLLHYANVDGLSLLSWLGGLSKVSWHRDDFSSAMKGRHRAFSPPWVSGYEWARSRNLRDTWSEKSVMSDPFRVLRGGWLCILLMMGAANLNAQSGGQVLYNGIALPQQWPPVGGPSQNYNVPSYITNPPAVIPINTGRQLFVDDFLIQSTTLTRTQHQPLMYPGNPILTPGSSDTTGNAFPYSDGVWFDPATDQFRMWFYCGAGNMVCYAYSTDGKSWIKPALANAVTPNTDQVLEISPARDSGTVWMDLADPNPARKFKAFIFNGYGIVVYFSPDGISWTQQSQSQYPVGVIDDRTTLFWNPFRNVWVDSIKNYLPLPASGSRPGYTSRVRYYAESPDLTTWTPADFTDSFWTGPDVNDPPYVTGGLYPQLYNLDAVAYESVIVGLFSWYYPGPAYPSDDPSGLPGPALVELGAGFSRDGFQWVRPTRGSGPSNAFIPASNLSGTWNMGDTQSAGGGFLVVGDELWFYFSGRNGPHGVSTVGATGLATLRRDGFYSMDAGSTQAELTTRPVQFAGNYMFVNVNDPSGQLLVEVTDTSGNVIAPYSKANCVPLSVNKTLQQVNWNGATDLSSLAGQSVRFNFYLTSGSLYSFWVTSSLSGASNGYVAANGPGFTGPTDNQGSAAYPTTVATPEIIPAGALFNNSTTVTLYTGTAGATINYTLDGSPPTALSPVYTAPFSLTASATVKAVASAAHMTTSAAASAAFTRNNTPPTISLTSPANGQSLFGAITLSASASDVLGIASVQFLVDGVSVGTVASAPYTLAFDTATLANATHQITAVAVDTAGNPATSSPVTVTFNNVVSGPTSGLVGYWSFDSAYTIGSTVFDQSGNSGNATAYSTTSVPGEVGQALQFNGSSSYAQVVTGSQAYDLLSNLSLSLWVQTTNASRDEALVSKYSAAGSGYGYLLRTTPAGTAELLVGGANVISGPEVATDVTKINDGNWHHLAVVIQLGTSVTFYVDGVLSSTVTMNSGAGAAATWFQMGLNPWSPFGTFFTGSMDEVRVYNRALSASDVLALAGPVVVSPRSATLVQGQTQQFTAIVKGVTNQSVNWSMSGTTGSVSSAGLYTAPASVANSQTINVTATSVANSSLSGTATVSLVSGVAATTSFVGFDTVTQGSWHGVYGGDGYSVAGDSQSIPSYATLAVQNQANYTWASSTTDPRALQTGSNSGRIAATWYSYTTFNFDVNLGDGNTHRVALYALDWDNYGGGRAEQIQIVDATTGSVLDTRNISSFTQGVYLVWNISGHVKINVMLTGGGNAVVSGVFFGGSGVTQSAPTITWAAPAALTYGTTLGGTQLDAAASFNNAAVPGSFVYTPAAGTVLTAGSHTLSATFTPTDTIHYTTATATASIIVNQATPAIAWAAPAAITYGTALSSTQLDASASFNNATVPGNFAYTPASGTILGVGSQTLSVLFTPTDTTDYKAASSSVTLVVTNQNIPAINWPASAAVTYGTPLGVTQLDATASFNGATVPGSSVYTPAAGTVLTAGSHTLSVTFTPTDTTHYATVTATVGITVNQAAPTITWATPSSISYGTALSSTQLDASASFNSSTVPGNFAYTPLAGTILSGGNQTLSVTFTPTDMTDYKGATAAVTIVVTTSGTPSSQATFVGADTVTQGNWHGVYGGDGYSVAGDSQSIPSYAAFSIQNQSNYTWSSTTTDPRALQTGSNLGRIAATWFNGAAFNFNINLTDGNTHQVALYALDWDNYGGGRAEQIQIVDAASSTVLDTRTISSFTQGIYLVWNISGNVKINITLTGGGNAVISGVFLGSTAIGVGVNPPSVTLAGGQAQQFTAQVTGTSNKTVTWSISPASGSISATGQYAAPATISNAQTVTVTATSAASGTAFGTATVQLSTAAGAIASFTGFDTATQGNWKGVYGADGYSIANSSQSLPAYASAFAAQNQSNYTWASGTIDPRALQTGSGSGRIAATWFSGTTFNFLLNLTDGNTHRVAVYALDWDNYGRSETIQVLDAATNAVLDSRSISAFTQGVYLVWNISGNVKINVTTTGGLNSVVSGVFFK